MCEYDCNIEETSGLSQCYVAEPNMLTERVQPRLVDYAIALLIIRGIFKKLIKLSVSSSVDIQNDGFRGKTLSAILNSENAK
jgi:hypothetical protein